MGQSFSQQSLKVNAKMSSSRLAMMRNKKSNLIPQLQREIAELLSADKVSLAEIKVETVIREKDMIVATEVLQLHSDRVLARAAQIASQAKCPEDVFTSLATIIYCSSRLPVPEFKNIATQVGLKYTKEWVMPLTERRQYVDPKVLQLIDIAPPPRARVIAELKAIAEQFDVAYEPPAEEVQPAPIVEQPAPSAQPSPAAPSNPPPSGHDEAALARDLKELDAMHDEKLPDDAAELEFPDVPSDDAHPKPKSPPSDPCDAPSGGGNIDDITRRFNELKNR
ncbi:IST1 like protein [Plasmodiophora brassicae]